MNTIVNNAYGLIDCLEEETYEVLGYLVDPDCGATKVRLMRNPDYIAGSTKPENKYPFKCDMYPNILNNSKKVRDERTGGWKYGLYDENLPRDAVYRPKCIRLYFEQEGTEGGYFTAYLCNYIMKKGKTVWQKFVEDMSQQLQKGGMNITNTLMEMTRQTFTVWLYRNPKYKDKQVCYTEKDYLYWASQEAQRGEADEEYKKLKAARKAAKK